MELKDLIVTPIILFIVYALAYLIRPKVTDGNTKKYFIPALSVKIIGAIAVGLIYQFYYGGGDTFAYHTHGSRVIWEAFMEDPVTGLKLFLNYDITEGVYGYAHRIWYYGDPKSFFVIQIATLFDLLTFGTYSATAVMFAVFSFSGMWALYRTFYNKFRTIHFGLAIAVLFVPTLVFWGSGILKDTVTIGALGWMTYGFDQFFIRSKIRLLPFLVFSFAAWMVYSLKVYILLSFLPALIIWFYLTKVSSIRKIALKVLIAPLLLSVVIGLGYLAIVQVGEDNPRYQLDRLAYTAKITAYDIRFGWGARHGEGSGYYLGELDGSFGSMIALMPAAVNVSLFRPYLWEVENPLMALSALESLMLLIATLYVIFMMKLRRVLHFILRPEIAFCFVFAVIFAFAVGVSTYNFGTLSRYKIPLMPFYVSGLVIIVHNSRQVKATKLKTN